MIAFRIFICLLITKISSVASRGYFFDFSKYFLHKKAHPIHINDKGVPCMHHNYTPTNQKTARPDHDLEHEPEVLIKQNSSYVQSGKCAPDNSPFWEDGHNPLSSKGN